LSSDFIELAANKLQNCLIIDYLLLYDSVDIYIEADDVTDVFLDLISECNTHVHIFWPLSSEKVPTNIFRSKKNQFDSSLHIEQRFVLDYELNLENCLELWPCWTPRTVKPFHRVQS
jgi:hypothetical protein